MVLEVGAVFRGRYRIEEETGRGGMTTVYLAYDTWANRTCAIKAIRKEVGDNQSSNYQSLKTEVRRRMQIQHPNIQKIYEMMEDDKNIYIVMQSLIGRNLLDVVRQHGPVDREVVVSWMRQLCDAIGYLHRQIPPILCLDIKPGNILLSPSGDVFLIEFIAVKEEIDSVRYGTRGYAAPEQFVGMGCPDVRSDIYGIGITMYHLLTGYSPEDTQFIIFPIGDLRPEFKGTNIEKVVSKCCMPSREDRYQSIEELQDALGLGRVIIHDPIEYTAKYKRIERKVHKKVVKKIGKHKTLGYCHAYWGMKKAILKEKYGIDWESPADLNPNVYFD